jgi:8-amino-7-oxononanoate synthase
VPDFTSALYLGLQHARDSIGTWERLTTGTPFALAEPKEARSLARRLAALQESEAATLAPSTLHAFWDLCGLLASEHVEFFVDAECYPIARWGVERAVARGAPTQWFPHLDAGALHWRLRRRRRLKRRPVVVTDGFCPHCGCVSPLGDYLAYVRAAGGLLVVDDTQALGVLGADSTRCWPYGAGGGGSLPWLGVGGPEVMVVASLAKGFGVPLTVMSGSELMIHTFLKKSETRQHCSPPSAAALHAACRALSLNEQFGDALRCRLLARVRRFREILAGAGLLPKGGLFPVQTLSLSPGCDLCAIHARLVQNGVRALLQRDDAGQRSINFLITARHSLKEIEQAGATIVAALRQSTANILHIPRDSTATSTGSYGRLAQGRSLKRMSQKVEGEEGQ